MGLEDIGLFGTLPGSIVLQPCDAVSTTKLLPQMTSHKSFAYMRTLRPKTPVLYKNDEAFSIGGSKILRMPGNDQLTIVATGITVFEALKAADELQKENISIRVVDCYSIHPLDAATLRKCIRETDQRILITVEDHFEHGGLGDFAAAAVSGDGQIIKLAVRKISESGTKEELFNDAGIDAKSIVSKVKSLVKPSTMISNYKTGFMENYELELEAPWDEVKDTLQEINVELTDEDLYYEKGSEKDLLERLSPKMHNSVPEVKGWIESVSHNNGLAY